METKRERVIIPVTDGWNGQSAGDFEATLLRPAVCRSLAVFCEDGQAIHDRPEVLAEIVAALLDAGVGCLRLLPDGRGAEDGARGVVAALEWASSAPATRSLSLGAVGLGVGINPVLAAAAEVPQLLGAIVGVAPRPRDTDDILADVIAPTLLVAESGHDRDELDACRVVVAKLQHAPSKLVIGPGVLPGSEADASVGGAAERQRAAQDTASHARIWLLTHLMPEDLAWMSAWSGAPPWSERLF
jgi:hypothetical protein